MYVAVQTSWLDNVEQVTVPKLPPSPPSSNTTVPVGVMTLLDWASDTVAVQLVVSSIAIEPGAQPTVVVVAARLIVMGVAVEPELPALSASPAYDADMVTVPLGPAVSVMEQPLSLATVQIAGDGRKTLLVPDCVNVIVSPTIEP